MATHQMVGAHLRKPRVRTATGTNGTKPGDFAMIATTSWRNSSVTLSVARQVGLRDARILDVGCGTGWLGHALLPFGRVSGIDLSPASIAAGSSRYPELTLICGDFLEVNLGEQFDFVVSADALPHMPDHEAFFHRIGALLKPGGTLLLMTMNPQVWCRRSVLVDAPDYLAHASTDEWPTLGRIRKLLRPSFTVQR